MYNHSTIIIYNNRKTVTDSVVNTLAYTGIYTVQ